MRVSLAFVWVLCVSSIAAAQSPDPGRAAFVARCAGCHGTSGNGGELGPAIAARIPARTDQDLATLLRQGLPGAARRGRASLSDTEAGDLVGFLRTLRPPTGSTPARARVSLGGGRMLE